MLGLDLLGAVDYQHPLVDCVKRGEEFARSAVVGAAVQIGTKYDIFTSPSYVIVNPLKGTSTNYSGNVARTVITGGKRHKSFYGDSALTGYDTPKSVVITLKTGKVLNLTDIGFVTVKGGAPKFDSGTSDTGLSMWSALAKAVMIGTFDLASQTHQLDALKQPTVAMARAALKQALATINQARTNGASLPGGANRDACYWKLDYYSKQLASRSDMTAPFGAEWPDMRKWVLQAYIEANAVEEGAAFATANWNQMWDDIGTEMLKLPAKVQDVVFDAVTTIVPWYLWAGGAALLGGVIFVVYKALMAAAPAAAAQATKRYLP